MHIFREPVIRATPLSALHILIIVLSMAMTLGAWLYAKQQTQEQIATRFASARDRAVRQIVDRMSRYEDALLSGVASFDAHDGTMTHEQWAHFAQSLHIEEKYPGVNGIGVIYQVEREDLPSFLADRAAENRDFAIYPDHDYEMLFPITYIEPEAINMQAIGLDMAHEENRRTGLLASRDTGTAQITGPIVLVQDSGHTPGFLFFAPMYQGTVPDTVEERRAQFSGVVYAPFVVRNLMAGVLSSQFREVLFSIQDGTQVIYDEHNSEQSLNDPNPMFTDRVTLNMYGREWVLDMRSNLAFREQNSIDQSNLILTAGLIIELLVIALVTMMARANQQAKMLANELTQELRAKTEKLERVNAEIEQFVYIASHDLKTPVRGVGLLTDALEEDIDDLEANPGNREEIASHIKMIRERVSRMNNLTEGIMEYSRVGAAGMQSTEVLRLDQIIKDCIADFSVEESQVVLDSDVEQIEFDGNTFRRVLENLIGNAIKYHPDKDAALVQVEIRDCGDCLETKVHDNGNGIAPEHHLQIFDVFQTLRRADDPPSTGIGLAIVKKAVERYGYQITVNSKAGAGATFTFRWPKQEPPSLLADERVA